MVGKILRYQLIGPDHYGLTQLRTFQNWLVTPRPLSVSSIAQVLYPGGTTKEYEVEAYLAKLESRKYPTFRCPVVESLCFDLFKSFY